MKIPESPHHWWSHLHQCVLTVSVKAIPFGVKGLVVAVSIHLTLPGAGLVSAAPLTPVADAAGGVDANKASAHKEQEEEDDEEEECTWLPGFAVGGNTLTSVKDFPAVHAGAVFGEHAVPSVVFVVVVWAVASAVTAHIIVLRRNIKAGRLIITRVFLTADYCFSTHRRFTEAVAGFSSRVNLLLNTVDADLSISAP